MSEKPISGEDLRRQQRTQDRLLTPSPWLESAITPDTEHTTTSPPEQLSSEELRESRDVEDKLRKSSPWLE
jgi:hypothetical protein